MTLEGGIRGTDNTSAPMMDDIAGLYIFRAMSSTVLTRYMGVFSAWTTTFVDSYLQGLIFYIIYRRYFYKLIRRVA